MLLLTLMNVDKDVCETTLEDRNGHLKLCFLLDLSGTRLCSFGNMDHRVCLHFCERVHFSFLSPKWMMISVNFVFTECKHWPGLMDFECVHFST